MTPQASTFATPTFAGTSLADAVVDPVVDPVVVTRWRRSGRDRAYVHVDGRNVGFRDLVTGVAECTAVAHLDTLMHVTDDLVHLRPGRSAA
jgi:hypothetical protein